LNQSFFDHYNIALNKEDFAWLWSMTATCNYVGMLLAALVVRTLMDDLGRKNTAMVLRPIIGLFAAILMVIAKPLNSFECFAVGYALAGASSTLKGVLIIYLAECSPDRFRGLITLTTGTALHFIAVTIATTLALPEVCGNADLWPILPFVSAIFALLHFGSSYFLPPSPKHLHITRNESDEARRAIRFYHGDKVDQEKIISEYNREHSLVESRIRLSVMEILRSSHLRTPLLVCIVASLTPQLSASSIRGQYSASMLKSYGMPDEWVMITIMSINFITTPFCILAPWLIERIGRRPLFLACVLLSFMQVGGLLANQLIIDTLGASTTTVVVGLSAFLCGSFASVLGVVTIACILVSELCPQATRSAASQAIFILPVILSLVTVFLYPPALLNIGGFVFVPLLVAELAVLIIVFLFLPETRNLSVGVIVGNMMDSEEREQLLHERSRSISIRINEETLIASCGSC
uniref:Major facilitator superfamily (MFS) profile domain-containing protein n=1 Tax=Plectus sambesii TaxID=2011161 RepID=A0A914XBP8_9BILA